MTATRLVVERDTTGPNWVDAMDDLPDRSARQRFIAIYLGLFLSPCQGEGRGFESPRPLSIRPLNWAFLPAMPRLERGKSIT